LGVSMAMESGSDNSRNADLNRPWQHLRVAAAGRPLVMEQVWVTTE
jgi:hypothetical protein